jgi:1,4-dihydroxy-2-naphthoate octaprenyltransferase
VNGPEDGVSRSTTHRRWTTDLGLFAVHLRLPFQLMLAPIFLLGAFSAGHRASAAWILPFLAVHVGLYGGATAYNSYYDQDRGPISFLKRPRPASAVVRDLALVLQGAALLALLAVGPQAFTVGLAMAVMGVAYSHPRFRWKASTWGGLAAVALGQGAGAVYLGCFATASPPHPVPVLIQAAFGSGFGAGLIRAAIPPGLHTHWTALGAAFITAGLFPVTQVYQIDEDRARGDLTLPVRFGWRRSFLFAFLSVTAGMLALASGLRVRISQAWSFLFLACPIALALALFLWGRRFERQSREQNHDWAMTVGMLASSCFWVFLAVNLW